MILEKKITQITLKETVSSIITMITEDFCPVEVKEGLENVIADFYEYNISKVKKAYKKHFTYELPKVVLSDEIIKAMGSYSNIRKEVFVYSQGFEKFLLLESKKNVSMKRLVDCVNARMLFTMLHEFGHHHYYESGAGQKKLFTLVSLHLKKLTGNGNLKKIKENKEVEKFVMQEALDAITSEKYADHVAFTIMGKEFAPQYSVLGSLGFKYAREISYEYYAKTRLTLLVDKTLHHLPKKDRENLKEHYIKILSQR